MKAKHKPIKTLREAERWIREHAGWFFMGRETKYQWEARAYINEVIQVGRGKSAADAVDQLALKLETE